jgi:aspartyl-tRNA(Asn)/glutamyl-tRNA(Gln) amidotransferase subunit A
VTHPLDLPVAHVAARVRDPDDPLTARALVEASLDRLQRLDPQLNAFLTVTPELALAHAAAVDARVRSGDGPPLPLAGLPLAVKDNLAVAGVRMTCGSRILEDYVPPVGATCATRAVLAGACVVGKTNLDEFAMGSSTENSAFGPTRNPYDLHRVPGGSSGGSAAAVAAGIVPLALGSDTGGSVRQPAAFTGTVGMKPSYGRVSRSGLTAFASSLDQVGPFARTVADAAALLQAIEGPDPLDATTRAFPEGVAPTPPEARGLRVGIVSAFAEAAEGDPDVARAFQRARTALRDAGAREIEVEIPDATDAAIAVYYVVAPAEASSNLARYDGVRYGRRGKASDLASLYAVSRAEGFGPEVRRRILVGTFVLSTGYAEAYYRRAMAARALLRDRFEAAFAKADVLLSPTTPTPAFRLGEKSGDPVAMYRSDVLTVAANLAGVPAISLPAGRTEAGLPVGLQLWGRTGADGALLGAAALLERLLGEGFVPPALVAEGAP